MQNLKFANIAMAMHNARYQDRMVKSMPRAPEEKVVIKVDRAMLESLGETGSITLRLVGMGGSSVMLNLKRNGYEKTGSNQYGEWTISLLVEGDGLLSCASQGTEILFYNAEQQKAASFLVSKVSQDLWLGDIKPMCERLQ